MSCEQAGEAALQCYKRSIGRQYCVSDLCRLLQHLGFGMRVRGSHHVFSREGIEDRINLQQSDAKAKPYQVKQVRSVILKYGLKVNDDG